MRQHRLSHVDPFTSIAVCLIDGLVPTRKRPNGTPQCLIARRLSKVASYVAHPRAPSPHGTHTLTSFDPSKRMGVCVLCGEIDIHLKGDGWRCGQYSRDTAMAYARAHGAAPRVSHTLSLVNVPTMLADCALCGYVTWRVRLGIPCCPFSPTVVGRDRTRRVGSHGLPAYQCMDLRRWAGRCQNTQCPDPWVDITKLEIDHDHDTGAIRGVLCGWCNSTDGYAQGSIPRLQGMIEYLECPPFAPLPPTHR